MCYYYPPTNESFEFDLDHVDFPLPSLPKSSVPDYYEMLVTWPQLYVELAIIIDHSLYLKHGHSKSKWFEKTRDWLKLVNYNFEPLNVKFSLVDLEIWDQRNHIPIVNDQPSMVQIMTHFDTQWHRNRRKKYDVLALISNVQFTQKGVMGMALFTGMCRYGESYVFVTEAYNQTNSETAEILTHEVGHLFYMHHDNESFPDYECYGKTCFMGAGMQKSHKTRVVHWSSISLVYMSVGIDVGGSSECLKNKPEDLFSYHQIEYPTCGDGFVDPVEECDCAAITVNPKGCRHECCNPLTCKLTNGSVCADGDCCNTNTCQLQPTSHACRPAADDECDLAEYCNEKSSECPVNIYRHDGWPCKNGTSQCYSGRCGFVDRCELIVNHTIKETNAACYDLNQYGNRSGNCGYFENLTFIKCLPDDAKCGLLQCHRLINEKHYYLTALFKDMISSTVVKSNPDELCVSFHLQLMPSYDHNLEHDYAPNGVPCGESDKQKVCTNMGVCCYKVNNSISCEVNVESLKAEQMAQHQWRKATLMMITAILIVSFIAVCATVACFYVIKRRNRVKPDHEENGKWEFDGKMTVLKKDKKMDSSSRKSKSSKASSTDSSSHSISEEPVKKSEKVSYS